jgi:hypothetical protein
VSLAENVAERLTIKAYSSGAITAGSEPVPSSAPGASGGQILRFVDHNLSLTKDTYASTEKRTDRQISDFRHGTRRAAGAINGLLSPATYEELFEAAFRGTWSAAVVTGQQSDFTSVSADNSTSKFTFAAGDPHTKGFRVGDVVRFSSLSDADNNSKNFVILAMGGSSNREWTVYPAPDTMSADTSFSVTTVGRSLIVPASSHVSRLFALESYQSDLDIAELFTECRIGGFTLSLPATGNSQVSFNVLGRNRVVYTAGDAPFFSSPTAQTSTGLLAAVNGLLRVNGTNIGVVTAMNLSFDLSPQAPPVVGTDLVPEIFLGPANVTGDFSAFFENASLIDAFDDETEVELISYLTTASSAAPDFITIHLPRIKLGGATKTDDASGGKVIAFPFTALRLATAANGKEATTIRITDSSVS